MKGTDPRPSETHVRQVHEYCDLLLPALREVARQNGYAIAVHGSLERDIDLIVVPWCEMALDHSMVISSLFTVVSAVFGGTGTKLHEPCEKPHGRLAYVISFCGEHFIDLSIMPRVETKEAEP